MTHTEKLKQVRTTTNATIGQELEEMNTLINDIVHFVDDIKHENDDEIAKIANLIRQDFEAGPLGKIKAVVTSYTLK